jgi:hypothetical protein
VEASVKVQESRERKRLYAPPRSALAVAGEPSAFGRGLWRRLRDSEAGCFLLVFIAVGLTIVLFGVAGTIGPWRDGLRANGDPRFFLAMMAFGTVFMLIALRMLQVVLTSTQSAARRKERPVSGQEPWTTDHPWKPEEMGPDYGGQAGGSVLGRVAFLALIGFFNLALGSREPILIIIIIAFDLLGLLILYDSLRALVQAARRVRPGMRWTTFPAFTGGRLEGILTVRPALRVLGPIQATLRCVQDAHTQGSEGVSAMEPFVIYEQKVEAPAGGEIGELPLGFDVPPDLPGTHLGWEATIYWQVALQIPIAGPDFETVFLAPIYERSTP